MDLGIDFGTTRTVVACADRGNHPVVGFTDAAGDGAQWIPTLVAERDGELRYGFDAAAVADDASFTVVRSFKRLLSDRDAGPGQMTRVGSSEVRVADLMAGFLGHVRKALVERSDVRRSLAKATTLRAAVAVPANAHGAQRLVTIDAFRRAGFEVAAMLNEPSAAGFEYTHRHRDTLSSRRDVVVVYDLGGGTFDASVVRMTGRRHEVLATAGIGRLGGDDFDDVLAEVALGQMAIAPSTLPARALDRLLNQCRAAKEALNPSSRKITIDIEAVLGAAAPRPEVTIPVADFYTACTPLVERTIDAMVPLMSRVEAEGAAPPGEGRETPREPSVDLAEIAGVYVVGGASELPIIARALRTRFGRRVHRSPYPSAAVAIGLSIAADAGAGFELVDRYARTFGVFREGEAGRAIVFDPIFTPSVELPVAGAGLLTRTRAYRAAHNVGHFRFFECGALDDDGRPHGDMTLYRDVYFPFDRALQNGRASDLSGVAVARATAGEGPRVVERYSLDESGIVDVVIRDEDSGYERAFRLGKT